MKSVSLFAFLLFFNFLPAQSDTTEQKFSDIFELSGYIKDLQILSFGNKLDNITNDNLIHNRLNFKVYPSDKWTIALEFRNRIFTGETVESTPFYGDIIGQDNGFIDLSWSLINEPPLVFISQIDRAWLDWSSDNWEIRIGRQRINWGMNLFWNSNDLFNAYSFVDFDYEERAGSDALRIQRHFKNYSTLDIAIKPGKNSQDWIGAIRYGFNKWTYDFQFILGKLNNDYTIGWGWAGNVGGAGFKGETTLFLPDSKALDQRNILSASLSFDYIFSNQLFITGGFLYNSGGESSPLPVPQNLFLAPVSAKSLMPSKYNFITSASFPLTPLAGFAANVVYSPGVNSLLLMPSFNWSIANNWEIALFAQNFNLEVDGLQNIGNGIFIRVKGSY